MKTIIKICTVLVLLTGVFELRAQNTLTLEACRMQALQYNKELKNADLARSEAERNKKVAETAYLPTISASLSAMHSFQGIDMSSGMDLSSFYLPTAISPDEFTLGNYNGVAGLPSDLNLDFGVDHLTLLNGGFSLEQPVYVGGKIRNSNKQADIAVKIAESSYKMKTDEVIELTDQSFWNVASIEANIELAQKYIAMLSELEEQMTVMYEAGLQPASEKLKVSVQKNDAELQLLIAKNGLKIAKMHLNQVIGRNLTAPFNIAYDSSYVAMFNTAEGIDLALQNREELKVKEMQVELSELQKKIDLSDYKPTVGVSAQYSKIYLDELAEDLDMQPMLAAQISIPLFKWGQGKYKQDAAKIKIQQAETELSNVTDLISLEVFQTSIKVQEAYEAILMAKRNIEQAEESLSETKASFEVGLNTTSDLLSAQADWQKAKSKLITAIAEYKLRITTWDRVTGQLSSQYNIPE